ncbi:hypothetical protein HYH03_016617 [Edaphochlamys debaryana]|uniref:Uncharacterized protein n=1 Tax=Edaphochlamys debaryana TaxID=47281 RepID=A0A835XJG6_9CHLO|nr:hypothetical protein HYH03_016617 [Edaphochlamys debaryana]|eukprot:KAG2484574.1 hypothetical protein HYH03_016617 [Edaphochlamys debaryana]
MHGLKSNKARRRPTSGCLHPTAAAPPCTAPSQLGAEAPPVRRSLRRDRALWRRRAPACRRGAGPPGQRAATPWVGAWRRAAYAGCEGAQARVVREYARGCTNGGVCGPHAGCPCHACLELLGHTVGPDAAPGSGGAGAGAGASNDAAVATTVLDLARGAGVQRAMARATTIEETGESGDEGGAGW